MKKLWSYIEKSMLVLIFIIFPILSLAIELSSHQDYKKIKLYYTDGTNEVINFRHKIYFDNNFTQYKIDSSGCVFYGVDKICGVRKIKYL